MSYTIYKATNIQNGKCYIGFDSKWPARIQSHKTASVKGRTLFYAAIRKYGWESFLWEVLYQSWDKQHCLTAMEPYFISEYSSYKGAGYNMTKGGEGANGYTFTEEVKRKMSESNKGKSKSSEHCLKISLAKAGIPKTQEHKDKISTALIGRKQSEETRKKKSISFAGRKQTAEWVQKRVAISIGMVTVVSVDGKTKTMPVSEYKNQMIGATSEWVTNRSNEGRRRLGEF